MEPKENLGKMDRDFHTDDFERLLREKSDEFRMYPSKRIWHSIYNNIHPGHKWPSVAMCITLISALLLVGYLNTRNANSYSVINKIDNNNQPARFIPTKSIPIVSPTIIADEISSTDPLVKNISDKNTRFKNSSSSENSTSLKSTLDIALKNTQQIYNLETSVPAGNIASNVDLPAINLFDAKSNSQHILNTIESIDEIEANIKSQKDLKTTPPDNFVKVKIANQSTSTANESVAVQLADHPAIVDFSSYSTLPFNNEEVGTKTAIQIEKIASEIEKLKLVANENVVVSSDEKNWIDHYALYNRPAPKKWANKLDWQVYATPSVVYRTLSSVSAFGNTLNATPFAISSSNQNINSAVIQTPSVGFELGTGLKYLILKNVRIKGGVQINFTRYNAHAFENSHPVATKLTMHNFETKTAYEVYRSTAYSNNSGLESLKLHNETFQISLPIGADLKLIGNDRLAWNVGATIQPTFVAGGKSYLISSDRHNYVKETSMLNRWNLNAGFETFISFKSNGLTWQIGPQFRKQLISTNSKTFAVEEKLVNYGIKFGISKTLK